MSSSTSKRFSRVLSLRGDKHRNRSRSRPRTDFLNLHTLEEAKRKLTKEEDKKVQELKHQLSVLGLKEVPESRIEYAIKTKSSEGDVKKALRTIIMIEDAAAGVLSRYDPNVKMLGAENREKVTCYLDTLLFAMFAKPDVFEAMLFKSYEDEPRRRLVTLIRLWVNLLRNGRLITVDLMQKIQETLAECGWPDAARAQQQDVSEAFCFITDKLNLPLLTLQTDLFHAGKIDAEDDHKFITERMLDVAIPEDIPADETVTLEKCLEEYFNNRVEVKRHLLRKATLSSTDKVPSVHVESLEADSEGTSTVATASPTIDQPPPPPPQQQQQRPAAPLLDRTLSIFSERKVQVLDAADPEEADPQPNASTPDRPSRQRANSMRKEVMMPAWQFLNLIPWYTGMEPSTDAHTKEYFTAKRPMLGICLKRYKVSPNGTSSRLNTHIDIPLEMSSPHFATTDGLDLEDELPTGNFKLSLQSVICHRGIAVDSGHYIALLRAGSNHRSQGFVDASETLAQDENDPGQDTWLCFDDLASERVRPIDIVKSLRDESPYILFYRVQPINPFSGLDSPPPYSESSESFDLVDQKLASFSENGGGAATTRRSLDVLSSQRPSPRISIDVSSLEHNSGRAPSAPSTRRGSVAYQVESGESGGSIGTAATSAERTSSTSSPTDEAKPNLSASIKSLPRKDSNGKSSNGNDKRLSGTWSLIAAKLSRDKGSLATIVVNEVAVDDQPTSGPSVEVSKDPLPEDASRLRAPEKDGGKEKKRKSSNRKSRTSSMNELAEKMKRGRSGKKPERECAMM